MVLALAASWRHLTGLFDGTKQLESFPDRAIGRVVLEGIDASGYLHHYVAQWTLLVGTFLVGCVVLLQLRSALARWAPDGAIDHGLVGVARLSELVIALCLLRLVTREERILALAKLCVYLLLALIGFLTVKMLLIRGRGTHRMQSYLFTDSDFLVASLFYPVPILIAWDVLGHRALALGPGLFLRSLVLYGLFLAAIFIGLRWRTRELAGDDLSARVRSIHGGIVVTAAPCILFPLAIPFANELQYITPNQSPERVFLACGAVLIAMSGLLWSLWYRRDWKIRIGRLLGHVYFPILTATVAVFAHHRHTWHLALPDYFHFGEFTLPTHQLFRFGSLPQIDLRLTHSFSDMFYQTLFALFSGDSGINTLVWVSWLPEVVALMILYFFLARSISPGFAVLVTCLMPVTNIASAYYAPALLPALFLYHAAQRPTWQRLVLLWVSAIGLTLWRIDFGLAACFSLALALGTLFVGASRERWKALAISLVVALSGATLAMILVSWLAERSLFDTLHRLFGSYSSRMTTRTRSQIIDEFNLVAVLQYYLLPAVAAFHLAFLAVSRWLRRACLEPRHFLLLYLASFSLIISVRSVERHSLIESFNPYLFALSLGLLPCLWAARRETAAVRGSLLGTMVLAALFVLPPASFGVSSFGTLNLVGRDNVFELRQWKPAEARVQLREGPHSLVVDFLKKGLDEGQTFYDFTNSPLLYVLADKQFPTWIIPNLIQTSERVQKSVLDDLSELLREDRLPFVLFKQGSRFWDNADGVPNEIRSYRIAEFIYRNYEPLWQLGTYQVWGVKNLAATEELIDGLAQSWPLEPTETVIANHLEVELSAGQRRTQDGEDDSYVHGFVDPLALPLLSDLESAFLRFRYSSTTSGSLEVYYGTDGEAFQESQSATIDLKATSRGFALVPIVARGRSLTDFRFDPPEGSTTTFADLEVITREILPLRRLDQQFDLFRLPSVWAKLDPLDALKQTSVQTTLQESTIDLASGEQVTWTIDPELDRTQGNYLHLRIRPEPFLGLIETPSKHRIELRYGHDLEDGFDFELQTGDWQDWILQNLAPRTSTELNQGETLHNMKTLPIGDRLVVQAVGPDPYFSDFVDLSDTPTLGTDDHAFLRFHYRAKGSGPMQIFFGVDGRAFEGPISFTVQIRDTGEMNQTFTAVVPLPEGMRPYRWTDLRFDPPLGSYLEVVEAELVLARMPASDYLVRMSTQWKWWVEPPERITLRTAGPISLQNASIRSGD